MAEEEVIPRQDRKKVIASRDKLWAQDPRCHWCGVVTVKIDRGLAKHPDLATLDHLKPRWQCKSKAEYGSESNHVLACRECNNLRDRIDKEQSGRREWEEFNERKVRAMALTTGRHIERILRPASWSIFCS